MNLMPGMSEYDPYLGDLPAMPFVAGPFIRTGAPTVTPGAPRVATGAPVVMPPMPGFPPSGAKLGCTGCTRGMGMSLSTMTTGQKVALGLASVAAAIGGYFAYRHFVG